MPTGRVLRIFPGQVGASPDRSPGAPEVLGRLDASTLVDDGHRRSPLDRQLVEFYEAKTESILRRYGPGPRVHFHTGFVDEPAVGATAAQLRAQLCESQERMLEYAACAWRASSIAFRDVLDVGCGLGGGSIFWAQRFGAQVTALTIAPTHVELVGRFAAQAGVGSLVKPMLCDALAVPGEACFDAAIAIDSSSSFPRDPWFRRLAKALRRGGRVLIFDCFLGRSKYAELFNKHWCARIGTIDEYVAAARQANFAVDALEDVSSRAAHFWTTTIALTRAEMQNLRLDPLRSAKVQESLRTHCLLREGLFDGGFQHALMSFTKR